MAAKGDEVEQGEVLAVNVGRPREVEIAGREVRTAIDKTPIDARVRLDHHHVAGDHQADHEHHGGPWQAVYAYASEDTAWWAAELGRDDLGPGTWGENLTLAGVDPNGAVVGSLWEVGDARLRVTAPRIPCFKLAHRMGDPRFGPRFAAAQRPGTYLAIDRPGLVGPGDVVRVVEVPDHGVTIRDVAAAHHRLGTPDEVRSLAERILEVPDMHPSAVDVARTRLEHDA